MTVIGHAVLFDGQDEKTCFSEDSDEVAQDPQSEA